MSRVGSAKWFVLVASAVLAIGASVAGIRGTVYTKRAEAEPVGLTIIESWNHEDGDFYSDPIDVRGYSSIAINCNGRLYQNMTARVEVRARVSSDDVFTRYPDMVAFEEHTGDGVKVWSEYSVFPGELFAPEIQIRISGTNRHSYSGPGLRVAIYLE